MGTLTKKLHILKAGGTEETCDIYTTPEEVGGSPYLALEVDGTKGYVKLGSTTDANATHLRVEKNGTTYAAWKKAITYVNVTITQSANQTIHVYTPRKNGGTDHTSSFKIPKGTAYEAEVIAAGGYRAGTLNVSTGGVINSDMTFSASGASKKEKAFMVTAQYHVKYKTDTDGTEGEFWSRGFGAAYGDGDVKIGDITPQEIDGFKIIEVMDYGYDDQNLVFSAASLWANRKCILHIKGKDYNLTHQSGSNFYTGVDAIGIEDNEQIKVTYTLL